MSDFQYDEEKNEKVFMMSQADEVREKVLKRHLKHRLPRKKGMYELPTRRRSVQTNQDHHFYDGNHWEVGGVDPSRDQDVDVGSDPLAMEHTTRKLTIQAVNQAVDTEQERRIKKESRDMRRASAVLSPVNKELKSIVHKSKKTEKKKEKEIIMKVEEKLDTVLDQLLHTDHLKSMEETENAEREWRMRRMEDLTDFDKAEADKTLLTEVKTMSNVAKARRNVETELMGAFHDLEEVHDEVEHGVDDLYRELKDDFVLSFKRTTHLMKVHALEENERRRRLQEIEKFVDEKESDPVHDKAMDSKDMVQDELIRTFATVQLAEAEEEETCRARTEVMKGEALEELLHCRNGQLADNACVEERKRRIKEAESELQSSHVDPIKERMRDAVKLVQEQMLMKKFHGKKIQPRSEPPKNASSEEESLNDQRLRQMRMKARRKSCVQG
ncbi:centromere-associated protein E-like isoform X2 [Lytechinus variegatus]|nr:centromere-associated protein E-like isoform X2 [Lytechinus variegatus]